MALETTAVLGAGIFLTYAVAEAATTLAPWGDSPRVFYAALADVGIGIGTLLLVLAARVHQRAGGSRSVSAGVELLVYLVSAIALSIPLVISAANSLEASANGQGGPPLALEIAAGILLTVSLRLVMARRVMFGFLASGSLALLLTATALLAAR